MTAHTFASFLLIERTAEQIAAGQPIQLATSAKTAAIPQQVGTRFSRKETSRQPESELRKKRVKMEGTDDKSSDRGSISSAPPTFFIRKVVDSSEEDEQDLANQVKKLQADNAKLQARLDNGEQKFVLENATLLDRLEQAEGKLVLLAVTASKVAWTSLYDGNLRVTEFETSRFTFTIMNSLVLLVKKSA